jgi:starch-binding outer membrane protein, SusD/RagB family
VNAYKVFAIAAVLGTVGCNNFLSGGELSNNPNVADNATPQNLLTGTEVGLWNELGGDMSRVTSIWAQHLTGIEGEYQAINNYQIDATTTGGFQQGLYIQGGLVDIRNLEAETRASHDSLFLGIAQVEEAWLMGEGADLFGALVYSDALTGMANPQLDPQMTVYAHVEALLDTAITNMAATSGINAGPGAVDLAYGGDHMKWTHLAHTLKARFYMHQIHAPGVSPTMMADSALAQADSGLQDGEDYQAIWSGSVEQQNYWYQFNVIAGRAGYYTASTTLVDSLLARGDTAFLSTYFSVDTTVDTSATNVIDTVISYPNLASPRLQANSPQIFASNVENLLLLAEAAYRTGDQSTARAKLIAARTAEGVAHPTNVPAVGSGLPLLHAILDEKWISDFELGTEAWTDYRRTCTPNLQPTVAGGKIPGRLYYDTGEQQTNTSIPMAGQGVNGAYNQAQPPLTTSDGDGQTCLAQ